MKSILTLTCLIGLIGLVRVSAEPLIEGRVWLDSGEPVANAQVRLFDMTDLRQGAIARATTDGTGYFALPIAALRGRALPTSFALGPNYPNPFNPATIIPYQLAASSEVRLEVFNLLGQRITTLVDGARPAGFHTAQWHATDAAGRAVAAGVYIYRMTVGVERQTGRMVLVDGQAGVAAAGAASAGLGAAGGESDGASEQVYGLVVSGEGLAPYVDSAFRVQAGRGPVEWVVEALGAVPAKVSGRPAGLLGDVNNDNQVNSSDALLVAAYSAHAALSMPNNGNILLGDVNQDGQINSTDAQLIASKAVETADVIAIPDAKLRVAIEAALGKAPGATITNDEMATLTTLEADVAGIRDLTGLEFATNLTRLSLGANAITDISPLAGLTNLTRLYLGVNAITDISPLAGLTNLTNMRLWGNAITDVSALAGLTNLKNLWLQDNTIMDVSALAGLTNLTDLYLGGNTITDISPLAGLTNLKNLSLGGNAITDISPLAGLTNLKNLTLGDNTITDISPLAGLTNLTRLRLWDNAITDVSPLAGLTNLKNLYLRGNLLNASSIDEHIPALQARGVVVEFDPTPRLVTDDPTPVTIPDASLRAAIEEALGKASGATITKGDMTRFTILEADDAGIRDLTGLEFATNLTRLELGDNTITDVSALAGLTNLTRLELGDNNAITDVSALAGLTNLTWLGLGDNTITDVSALAGLTNLTWLELGDNTITDVSALAGLTNLTWLELYVNAISDVSPLAGLTNLTELRLSYNTITDVSPLAGLTNLTWLNLWGNTITDVSPLAGLTNLTWLGLSYNTITDVSPLAGLTNLTDLSLGSNTITDVSPLAGLTNLTWLELSYNTITDVSPLAGLTNLTDLSLGSNTITDVSPLAGLTNLTWLELSYNTITDVSPLAGLTNLKNLDLRYQPLSVSSINDHIPALERSGATVLYDRFREGSDFDIDLVFLSHFTEPDKRVIQYAAREWMSIIRGDLPDYTFTQGWSGKCFGQAYEIPAGERIDDLRIYVTYKADLTALGQGYPAVVRDTPELPVVGCINLNAIFVELPLHEIAHVLGIGLGLGWDDFLQDPNGDPHFNGPRAIAAFNDAGGRNYTGKKVPVDSDLIHWRYSVFGGVMRAGGGAVFGGELMRAGGGDRLSAITIQSLADMGYVVDVTQADPYTLPGADADTLPDAVADTLSDADADDDCDFCDLFDAFDNQQKEKVSAAAKPTLAGADRLPGRLAPQRTCGTGQQRKPIYVIDPQGNIVRTLHR